MKWIIPKKRGTGLLTIPRQAADPRNHIDDAAFGDFNSLLLDQEPEQKRSDEHEEETEQRTKK